MEKINSINDATRFLTDSRELLANLTNLQSEINLVSSYCTKPHGILNFPGQTAIWIAFLSATNENNKSLAKHILIGCLAMSHKRINRLLEINPKLNKQEYLHITIDCLAWCTLAKRIIRKNEKWEIECSLFMNHKIKISPTDEGQSHH